MNIDLTGQVALVTGASRGIGKAIAEKLAANGAKVIGTATSESGAKRISESLNQFNNGSCGVALDVTAADVTEQLAALAKEYGAINILVNNAGITRDGLLMRMSEDDWQDVINANLSGVFKTSKAVLRGMLKAKGGRIVNISSVVALMGNPGQANYCAAKAGVLGFTRSMAKEVASRGVTVNAIAPGYIETDMTAALNDEQKAKMAEQIPAARLGNADDIANAVLFLASPAAAYITGETLNVSGGLYMA